MTPKAIQERESKTVMKRRDLNCFKLPPRQDFDATGIPISIQQFARLVASPGNRNCSQSSVTPASSNKVPNMAEPSTAANILGFLSDIKKQ